MSEAPAREPEGLVKITYAGAPIGAKKWWCTTGRGGEFRGIFTPKTYLYIYTFRAGQKKWWCTCTTGTTYNGALGYMAHGSNDLGETSFGTRLQL